MTKNSEQRERKGKEKVGKKRLFFLRGFVARERDLDPKKRKKKKKTQKSSLTVRRVVVHARRARLLDALAAVPARVLVHADALFFVLKERRKEGW